MVDGTKAGTTITTAKLGKQTDITPTRLIALAERLEALGLITRERITASHGKGRAWAYHPVLPTDLASIAFGQEQDRLFRSASTRSAA
jgi:predicted transcriptional regulator